MQCLRFSVILIALSDSVFLATYSWAGCRCNVPGSYYMLIDPGDGVIEFRHATNYRSLLLVSIAAGEIVQSDGVESLDAYKAVTTWQQVTIAQTIDWVLARSVRQALPPNVRGERGSVSRRLRRQLLLKHEAIHLVITKGKQTCASALYSV